MKKALITFTQKDITKGRLTNENLELVINYVGDTTWKPVDFYDTIRKIQNGEVVAIAFTSYNDKPDNSMFLTYDNENAEYTDVTSKYIDTYRNNDDLIEVSFKSLLKTINNNK
jgi:hypothetical protein